MQRRRLLQGVLGAGACALGFPAVRRAGAQEAGAPERRAVERRRIPSTGELVPVIGLGTSRTFDAEGDLSGLVPVMRAFLDLGGSLVDSSPMYGRAESVVGELLAALGRRDVFYATKVWTDEGRDDGIAQMQTSARRMGCERLDLIQIHNLVDYATHLETLREWKAAGRVRYVGATEMRDLAEVERIVREDGLDFIQIPYSLTSRAVEERVLPAALEHGVAVLVMRPFEAGKLFEQFRGRELPEWAAEIGCASWAQLFLKFVLAHPAVTCPIPATSKLSHLLDNMQAGVGPLPDAELCARMVALLDE